MWIPNSRALFSVGIDLVSVASKKKTKKKKADSPRRTCRRLKKKYELRESEDDYVASKHDATSDETRGQIVQSDDDDELPIASILGNPSVAKDPNRFGCLSFNYNNRSCRLEYLFVSSILLNAQTSLKARWSIMKCSYFDSNIILFLSLLPYTLDAY